MKLLKPALVTSMIAAALALPLPASAHCDGLDGPVVSLARESLDSGNVNLVLPWVRADDEPLIRHAFEHARSVRGLGPEARQLADTYFFETVVRVHRASEGAPYTGLKPAGRDPGPAVVAADKALATGSPADMEKLLVEAVREGLHEQFEHAARRARFDANDVEAGRRYVQAYVPYVHFVERMWATAKSGPETDHAEARQAHDH